jgi:hypothetical protein
MDMRISDKKIRKSKVMSSANICWRCGLDRSEVITYGWDCWRTRRHLWKVEGLYLEG